MPHMEDRLNRADPAVLAVVAYFECMPLIFECLNPWVTWDHLLLPKAKVIERIYHYLNEKNRRAGGRDELLEALAGLMEVCKELPDLRIGWMHS